jgi:hypothetical protein
VSDNVEKSFESDYVYIYIYIYVYVYKNEDNVLEIKVMKETAPTRH